MLFAISSLDVLVLIAYVSTSKSIGRTRFVCMQPWMHLCMRSCLIICICVGVWMHAGMHVCIPDMTAIGKFTDIHCSNPCSPIKSASSTSAHRVL